MRCSNCGVCCTETEMLLSNKDIKKLESKGYSKMDFVRFDKDGYATLKNHGGYCVFYDREHRKCREYESRPSGCRVYPVIFDEENGIILDSICESRVTILHEEKLLKGKRVKKLLGVIDSEAAKRRS